MTADEAVLRRIRTRSVAAGAILSAAAFLFGWRAGVSLTISAGVVIFSFLVFEKLTERLSVPQGRAGKGRILSLLLVTAAGMALLVVVLRWEGFVPVAGFVGLSAVVLAIVAEIFERSDGS